VNAYDSFLSIRDAINEATAAHWSDPEILWKLNMNYRRITAKIAEATGDYFLKSSNLTPSSNQLTLPSDCLKPVYVEEVSSGRPVFGPISVRNRRVSRPTGSNLYEGIVEFYFVGNKLEVNQNSYSEQCTVWYHERVPLLHCGVLQTGTGATTLKFQLVDSNSRSMRPSHEDDYYANETVETIDVSTGVTSLGTISSYAGSTATATVGTMSPAPAATDYYGTVFRTPEESVPYLEALTITQILAKPGSAVDPAYFQYYAALLRDTQRDFDNWLEPRMQPSMVETTQVEV
jgi:hypothetical protein